MLTFARLTLASALLSCTACQLAVDFPPVERERDARWTEAEAGTDRPDAAPDELDAGSDATLATEAATADAAEDDSAAAEASLPMLCDRSTHAGCAADELCCGSGPLPTCEKTNASACSACGSGCGDPLAPHCRERACECVPGSGRGCAAGERCMGPAASARCVECADDAECAGKPAGGQCVAGRCVQCDRGAILDGSADDEGCTQATPICSAENRCVACTREPDDCPGDLFCNGAMGCLLCDAQRPIGANGCLAATPVCRLGMDGAARCAGCLTNTECGARGFCDTASGTCTNVCDPDGPRGDNGCTGATPYCAASGSGFACRGCTAADCTGTTPFCAMTGVSAGNCVACRDAMDCAADPTRPICDAVSATCRARSATDCAAPTPLLVDGRCVACISDVHCAAVPGSPYCDAATNSCVSCATLPPTGCYERSAATPFCNASTGACVRCLRNTDCSAVLTPSTTPICVGSTCVACNAPTVPNPATVCTVDLGGPTCITSGAEAGRCGAALPLVR